ncbi:alpha/beta hydrolase fold protein [Trichoderma gamsii]|uniref:Alpha/beta hydrolase fold protein n=1 Tax=Trichoderma gamsii TaxID=398673 RepID=A0A2P4ZS77_9HYPO|nr:alpha/beta hydrolase fold protein [Trichoderma gamsii]PON27155.1 alpha/beta hydrolase fold protein [Trichoderma gamsii]
MAMTTEDLMQQSFTVPTAQQYENFVQAHGIPSARKDMPEGGSALWFGSPSAKRVIAHVHGGGLVMYATPFHIGLAYNVYKAAISKDEDVAVVVLSYDTCPAGVYPVQLRQLVESIVYLMHGRDVKDIDLYGDSVGGILILAILHHITHPHPKVPLLSFPSGYRFGRILLVSPAVPIVTPALQRSKNIGLDLVGVDDIAQMWNIIESNHDPEVDPINPWFTPISEMREEWYETLPAGAITIISGAFELFEEDIIKLSQVIKDKHQNQVDDYVDENATHIAFVKEGLTNSPPSEYTRRVIEWAKA